MSSFSGLSDDDFWRRIDRMLEPIPNAENRAILRRYLKERLANGIKTSTLACDANAIRGVCLHMADRPLSSLTRDDVTDYVTHAFVQRSWRSQSKNGEETVTRRKVRLGEGTLSIRKVVIRDFVRWLRGTDDYPPEVKHLKIGRVTEEDSIPADELIERADLVAMIQAHHTPREKAMLAVLHESGLRAGEFSALNVRSVQFDEYGAVLTLPKKTKGKRTKGLKTGARRVRLFESLPYLQAWYEAHPLKNTPDAPLFTTDSRRSSLGRMSPNSMWTFVNTAGQKAGLQKHIHPHLFRHSAATERARLGWNEAAMRAFFGWSRSSDMPSRYVHLAGLDYEDMELLRRGKKAEGDKGKPALTPVICKACRAENLPTAAFCQACRQPVSPKAEEEIARRKEEEIREAVAIEVRKLLETRGGLRA